MGWGMPGGGMGMPGGYPPWPMPPMGGQPGVPNAYAYYGASQFGSQPGGGGGVPGQQQVGAGAPQLLKASKVTTFHLQLMFNHCCLVRDQRYSA